MTRPVPPDASPVIVEANWYRFAAAERIYQTRVMSITFIWIVHGRGTIVSAGVRYPMTAGSVLRLPWGHDVDYRADASQPFFGGTIHLVPRHDADVPADPRVAFLQRYSHPDDPLIDSPHRHGPREHLRPLLLSPFSLTGRRFISLGTYAVERFIDAPFEDSVFRDLGALLMRETSSWSADERAVHGVPAVLELMTQHVLQHLDRRLTVLEIAAAGGVSPATAERIFSRHTGQSVIAWVRSARMREAALLLRTSGLRSGEVARRVGYLDPLYFSRVFRSTYGVAPSRYASGRNLP